VNPHRRTVIALDFDRTFTSDVDFWRGFVEAAVTRGHSVICVTGRTDCARSRKEISKVFGLHTFSRLTCCIFCNHSPKRAAVTSRGYSVDIWIDDMPEGVGAENANAFQALERRFRVFETLPVLDGNPINNRSVWRAF
jgi:hypothetical protein